MVRIARPLLSNGMVYCSGQIGLNAADGSLAGNDIESQTRQVMKNLGEVLKAAGTGFDKRCEVFHIFGRYG